MRALDVMRNCPENCDTSCYRCMRGFKNKFEHGLLDRHVGYELLLYLLTGTLPGFNAKRLKEARAMLLSDLSRQGKQGVLYELDKPFQPVSGRAMDVPILVTKQGQQFAIALSSPLTPDSPADPELRTLAEQNDRVIVVNELLIRGNLPAATRIVQERLGLYGQT